MWGVEREAEGWGWGLHPASELIGTALLFYPPTERVVFGSIRAAGRPAPSVAPRRCYREEPSPPSTTTTTTSFCLSNTLTLQSGPWDLISYFGKALNSRFHLNFSGSSFKFYSLKSFLKSSSKKPGLQTDEIHFVLWKPGITLRKSREESDRKVSWLCLCFSLSRPALQWKMTRWARCLLDGVSLPHTLVCLRSKCSLCKEFITDIDLLHLDSDGSF